MSEISDKLKNIYGSFQLDEARHARPVEPVDGEVVDVEPEPSFSDTIAKKITDMQSTIEDLKQAIANEQESIKNGSIGAANGQMKIDSWQNRLNSTQYKVQMLQTALDAYLGDQSEDNELQLKIAAAKAR